MSFFGRIFAPLFMIKMWRKSQKNVLKKCVKMCKKKGLQILLNSMMTYDDLLYSIIHA